MTDEGEIFGLPPSAAPAHEPSRYGVCLTGVGKGDGWPPRERVPSADTAATDCCWLPPVRRAWCIAKCFRNCRSVNAGRLVLDATL